MFRVTSSRKTRPFTGYATLKALRGIFQIPKMLAQLLRPVTIRQHSPSGTFQMHSPSLITKQISQFPLPLNLAVVKEKIVVKKEKPAAIKK